MTRIQNVVVYPGYGVATISRELVKEINQVKVSFCELKFLNRDVTILVPKEGFSLVGVRDLSTKEDIIEIFDIFCFKLSNEWLKNTCMISWNRRNKDYQNRIRNGDLKDMAAIFRDLKYIELNKGLSFGEKSVLAQVEFLLAEECSVIEKMQLEIVAEELQRCCVDCINGKEKHVVRFLSANVSSRKKKQDVVFA